MKSIKNLITRKTGTKELSSGAINLGNQFIIGRNKSKEFGKLEERI